MPTIAHINATLMQMRPEHMLLSCVGLPIGYRQEYVLEQVRDMALFGRVGVDGQLINITTFFVQYPGTLFGCEYAVVTVR